MSRTDQSEIRMRLIVERPVPGVRYSLQNKKSAPVDAKSSAGGAAIAFEFPLRIAAGPKFYGAQVRSEGPERRFVYIASGAQAGDCASPWSRRMKIDIHRIPQTLLEAAARGGVLEGRVIGTGKDGTPACATIEVTDWQVTN
jgi:hypothetical protein